MKILKTLLSVLLIASLLILPCEAKTPWSSKPPQGSQIDWSNPITRGLVGCWLMNEGSGNIVKNIALNSNGINVGAFWTSSQKGVGLSFITDDYIEVSASNSLNITGNISIISIAKMNTLLSTDDNECFFGHYQNGGAYPGYSFSTTSQIALSNVRRLQFWNGVAWTTSTVDNNIILGLFRQYAVTLKGSSLLFFVNGTPVGSPIGSIAAPNSYSGIGRIGKQTDDSHPLDGVILSLYVYSRALSPSEIQQLYVEPYCFIKPTTDWNMIKAAVAAAGGWVQYIFHNSAEEATR